MGITWSYTTSFKETIAKLFKDYPTCKDDVCSYFKDKSFDEIFSLKTCLHDSGVAKLLKIRIDDSNTSNGKSAGFRIIALVNSRTKEVGLLTIFAKIGSQGKDNIDKSTLKYEIDVYQAEKKSGALLITKKEEKLVDII